MGKRGWTILAAAALWPSVVTAASSPAEEQAAGNRFFEEQVRPIFVEHCHRCHGADKQKANLRLDSLQTMLTGGDTGPAITPGDPEQSLLITAVRYTDPDLRMPPKDERLNEKQIEALTRWVEMGAPWPTSEQAVRAHDRFTEADRSYWAFQPLRRPDVPGVAVEGGNEIDAFIAAKHREKGLSFAPRADRIALIRRATFDLWGLPPTPEQIDAFVSDESPDAWAKLIDRLLADRRYGERWARHWLDLVRYADSDGFKSDHYRPHAYHYRDYVIRSLNADKPYDKFITEQLAGDEIAPGDPEALIATAFLRHTPYEYNQRNVPGQWRDMLNDVTEVTADVFLGMGFSCARCHDHKYDPILREDYYRLQAFFAPMLPRDDLLLATPEQQIEYQTKLQQWLEKTAEIRRQIDEIERKHLDAAGEGAIIKFPKEMQAILRKPADQRTPYERQLAELAYRQVLFEHEGVNGRIKDEEKTRRDTLKAELSRFDDLKPVAPPPAFAMTDVGPVAPPTVIPGDKSGRAIEPGFPAVLNQPAPDITPTDASTGRRTALAKWLTQPDHPLTSRVMVNRLWQHHFGRGIVATSSDFGKLGELPTHPQLLDWLAVQFVADGWSLKAMHKRILMSATYQQSSTPHSTAAESDMDNRWLSHISIRRLDAEQLRDAALLVSGELKDEDGGKAVNTSKPHRTIYTSVLRNNRDPLLDAFDAPLHFDSTAQRNHTTTATQALLLINGQWIYDRAEAMARRLEGEKHADDAALVHAAYRYAFGRAPEQPERDEAVAFIAEQTKRAGGDAAEARRQALADFCHVLLNAGEFLYVD